MISRFPGLTPTRSRAVVHDDLVLTVAVAPDPVTSSMYEQSAKALARIDESLALCGSDKSKILSAIVYNVGDMVQGWEIVEKLAGHPDRFIPGHDPIVSEIYPRASDKVDAFALHLAPSRSFAK